MCWLQPYNQRRSKERLRGDTKASASMRAWLRYDPAKELVREVAASAVRNVLAALADEREAARKAAAAAAERQRYAERKRRLLIWLVYPFCIWHIHLGGEIVRDFLLTSPLECLGNVIVLKRFSG